MENSLFKIATPDGDRYYPLSFAAYVLYETPDLHPKLIDFAHMNKPYGIFTIRHTPEQAEAVSKFLQMRAFYDLAMQTDRVILYMVHGVEERRRVRESYRSLHNDRWLTADIIRDNARHLHYDNGGHLLLRNISGDGARGRALSAAIIENANQPSNHSAEYLFEIVLPAMNGGHSYFLVAGEGGDGTMFDFVAALDDTTNIDLRD